PHVVQGHRCPLMASSSQVIPGIYLQAAINPIVQSNSRCSRRRLPQADAKVKQIALWSSVPVG
ncbi:MAG TPA: hypothetical protein VKY54_05590, partial [Kiloniellales bacterium]|nr:hypothetical protein [Kiloniellales bacterium]